MAKTVVILGGSYAGLHIAHALLKKHDKDVKVILVSKNSHFFWNVAAVRAIVPGIVKDEQLLVPLESALKRYPAESYELIIGSAESSDFAAKTVTVSTSAGSSQTLSYDHLVLATGSRCPSEDVPWKASHSYQEVISLLSRTRERVSSATNIVVAGAGPTGIEVAGELGYEFGKTNKSITLLCAGDKLMDGDIIAGAAANELRKLNVTVKYGARVTSSQQKTADGKQEEIITLANGETITTDVYLPTMGLVPNSEYIDAQYLDAQRRTVNVDDYFRVPGAEGVWAAGDIVCKPRAGFMITQKQAAGVAKNIDLVLKGKEPTLVKGLPVDVMMCAVGRGRGAGRVNSIKVPSFLVWMGKGRTLALQMVPGYIDGSVA
ncbi:hypothetical protein QBC46DRAFT_387025 [Diplogelasinospora grovesii]|uniref:FAD/NAD(P)-binding domain-containing protein n=1 Tax=Diplogelasinospora grovesii TaxID=303347 RepID=A0AAN6N7V9_9PEZI|nr:hypothetical protein QBC46DRAFT_387025 [Diplogelasinospora grovesii]